MLMIGLILIVSTYILVFSLMKAASNADDYLERNYDSEKKNTNFEKLKKG